ncbi:MAG: glycoside hydrolase family 97 catalytic domain-containing protein [Planctomycetales bacterium]|nr:glycoside hydrolase family 97 catalytic domain-containing protein [Planctomycetales bacterium]
MSIAKLLVTVAVCSLAATARAAESSGDVTSPDGRLRVVVAQNDDGAAQYGVELDGRPVLLPSKLGLVRDDADFTRGLALTGVDDVQQVTDGYEILTAKRRRNHYAANERVFHYETAEGRKLDIAFRVSDDGVAFRYVFPEHDDAVHRLESEATSFRFPADSRAWLQPMSVAKSGWEQSNPSYEEYYEQDIPVGTPSPTGAGWVFPALFRIAGAGANDSADDTWVLLSEAGLRRNYCGGRLASESPGGEYAIAFADPREIVPGGPANPESTLPWTTPWRIVVVGSLSTVAESMLGVHLADPPAVAVDARELPGKASWSWVLLKDDNTIFPVQKKFVDYAADMGWRYCLVDADWDRKIGEDKLAELVRHANDKGVKIIVWYNSAGPWNTTPYTPRDKMLTHERRIAEFEKLKQIGVAGMKIDFFGGDGQSMIGYYHDILADSAPYGLAINFHGATLPRGWQRTYPHLMTTEAIRGMEFITFEQANADRAPSHNAMLPFTRNVFDPMDYTPMALYEIPNIERRTTAAHELALSVLFTSGVQHYAETPEGMATVPDYVREFVKGVPSVWDDVKFLAGEPGKYVVLARRAGDRWWIAGINGEDAPRTIDLDLKKELGELGAAELIADGSEDGSAFRRKAIDVTGGAVVPVEMPPYGGFVVSATAAE